MLSAKISTYGLVLMILSVQCAVGPAGSKPVTVLKYPSGSYVGLVSTSKNQYGMNDGGIWQINYMSDEAIPSDDGQPVSYSLRLNASDFGYPGNLKKIMYVYSELSSEAGPGQYPVVTMQADEQQEFSCAARTIAQKKMVTPVKCRCQGTYWTVGLDSNMPFVLFGMSLNYSVRPSNVS